MACSNSSIDRTRERPSNIRENLVSKNPLGVRRRTSDWNLDEGRTAHEHLIETQSTIQDELTLDRRSDPSAN